MVGEKHPNWKGGVTELNALLREYFNTNLSPVVAKRDGYRYQLCGKEHVVLNVHHIVHFSEIVNRIISEHPELSLNSTEDKQRLYEIIT